MGTLSRGQEIITALGLDVLPSLKAGLNDGMTSTLMPGADRDLGIGMLLVAEDAVALITC